MDYKKIITSNKPYALIHRYMPTVLQDRATHLCWRYNMTDPTDKSWRKKIIKKLFKSKYHIIISSPFHCDYGFNIHFHGFTFINSGTNISDTSPINIGKGVYIAPNVCISCSGHPINYKQRYEGIMTSRPINIGNYVWIGANSFIKSGVNIGDHSVIGAGSVVTRSIPSNTVAFGIPCKAQRAITDDDLVKNIINKKQKGNS